MRAPLIDGPATLSGRDPHASHNNLGIINGCSVPVLLNILGAVLLSGVAARSLAEYRRALAAGEVKPRA